MLRMVVFIRLPFAITGSVTGRGGKEIITFHKEQNVFKFLGEGRPTHTVPLFIKPNQCVGICCDCEEGLIQTLRMSIAATVKLP